MKIRTILLALALAVLALGAAAQELEISLDTGGREWVEQRQEIELLLNRPLESADGRLAILIGQVDLTDLFRSTPRGLVYRAEEMPLPPGEGLVTVYAVRSDNDWREIAQLPLKVLTRSGARQADLAVRLDLDAHGVVDENPSDAKSENPEEANFQLDFQSNLVRTAWGLATQFNVIGVTEADQALRASTPGSAPRVDLSSYQLRWGGARAHLEIGHTSFGNSRNLIDGFQTRGVGAGFELGERASLALAVLNGSEVVGWTNPLGLDRSSHRIVSGGLGLEVLKSRPGGLRFDVAYLDGSVEPIDDFNQGSLNDAEQSDGWSLRLRGELPTGRVRFDGGFARSRFSNPEDPLLAQGNTLVAVEREERGARHLSLAFDLLGERTLAARPLSLTLNLNHDRVDPLYRSVAAYTRSDVEENRADLALTFGGLTAQLRYGRAEDNLDDIPSILKSRTRTSAADLLLPFGDFAHRGGVWYPTLSYAYSRVLQSGVSLPVNGGFSAGHVPDQLSQNHLAGLDWQGNRWQAGYRLGYTLQDNRQPGREANDFRTRIHTTFVQLALHPRFDFGFELSRETFMSLAAATEDETDRLGVNVGWHPIDRLHWTGSLARTDQELRPMGGDSRNLVIDSQLAWRFLERTWGSHGTSGQTYVRYSNEDFDLENLLFGVAERRRTHVLLFGLGLSFR